MKKVWILLLVFIAILVAWFYFTRLQDFNTLSKNKTFNILLITLDTTRADHLSCYGSKKVQTPCIDSLAGRGILYEKCISPTPLTLPAHTSIFTGTYPLFHGVRDNAAFVVPEDLTTLAEVFRNNGYKTAAFVSSFVLDSKWGLNQGFDYYYDDFDLHQQNIVSVGDIQRPGNQTVDAALSWLSKEKKGKFFLWVHLYDAHTPYDPPQEFKKLYPDDFYSGEIAFMDQQVGRLIDSLDVNGLNKDTLIFIVGDHGESLGEHQEQGHGFFIYEETLNVPFIISVPFRQFQGIRKKEITSLVDLMPTILEMTRLKSEIRFQGKSLVNAFAKTNSKAERFVYSETFYPRFHFGWSELQSIQDGNYKLVLQSDPEFFDLQKDPDEMNNLASKEKHETSAYQARAKDLITEWSHGARSQDYTHLDEETQEKLAALGYVGTFRDTKEQKNLASPRDKIAIYVELNKARELMLTSDFKEAEQMSLNIIKQDPGIIDAYSTLGNIYLKQNRYEEAVSYYKQALDLKPDDAALITGIAACLLKLNRESEAETVLIDSLRVLPSDSRIFFMLGNVYRAKKEEQKAVDAFNKCLELNPKSASAHNALAAIYFLRKDYELARKNVEAALRFDERLPGVHYTRAQIFEHEERLQEAAEEYKKELAVSNQNFRAAYNLSEIYRRLGNTVEEEKYLRKAIELNDDFPLSYLYLARLELKSGNNYDQAIDLVTKSLERKPEPKFQAFAYYLLADLYNRKGNQSLSREYAEKAQRLKQ
jgi:arylsulfatase A-like enzyme/Tfp pilus assembly protein PilF